jgi:hypothetical protein
VAKTKAKTTKRRTTVGIEPDAEYMLKLVLYLAAGSVWIRLVYGDSVIPLPLGFVIGLWFSRREKLQIDRKIEYAILLMAMFLGFWLMPSLNIIR